MSDGAPAATSATPPQVLTCTGPRAPESLGCFTLAREHLALNRAALYRPTGSDAAHAATLGQAPLSLGTLGDVRRRPYSSLPNLQIDAKGAGSELTRFSRAAAEASGASSGRDSVTVVETTPNTWRAPEDIAALARLAIECPSVRVVLGTGCVAAMEQGTPASDLAAMFVRNLRDGFSACPADGQPDATAAAAAPQGCVHHSSDLVRVQMAH
jgi:hypothetical protein